jgi:hypothetical protein
MNMVRGFTQHFIQSYDIHELIFSWLGILFIFTCILKFSLK